MHCYEGLSGLSAKSKLIRAKVFRRAERVWGPEQNASLTGSKKGAKYAKQVSPSIGTSKEP